jgi:hypothetical protein
MSKELIGVYQWQFNGCAPWDEIHIWCLDNLKYYWNNGFDTFHFDDKDEYAWFLLRWS